MHIALTLFKAHNLTCGHLQEKNNVHFDILQHYFLITLIYKSPST